MALAAEGVAHGRLDADHGDDEDRQVEVVPASIAKGLEFDRVVVLEPAAIVDAEPDRRTGLRRLYVVLTRAVSELTVVHGRPVVRDGVLVHPGVDEHLAAHRRVAAAMQRVVA